MKKLLFLLPLALVACESQPVVTNTSNTIVVDEPEYDPCTQPAKSDTPRQNPMPCE